MAINYLNDIKKPLRLLVLMSAIAFCPATKAQIAPQKIISQTYIRSQATDSLLQGKQMNDTTFQWQIKGALLYYPELRDAHILFRVKKAISPLAARPTIWAIFQKPSKRTYLVNISSKTIARLEPILLKNLSFNAQVGVLGHELAHVADYHRRKGGYFVRLLFMNLSKKAMDKFENDTDRRTIEQGLGYQLLAWSQEVRQNLKIDIWRGANDDGTLKRERYMSPETIQKFFKSSIK